MALELGIPRSTAIGWLGDSPRQVVSLDLLSLDEQELQHEVLMLRRPLNAITFIRIVASSARKAVIPSKPLARSRPPGLVRNFAGLQGCQVRSGRVVKAHFPHPIRTQFYGPRHGLPRRS